jgi:Protein of unknown function (DUF2804)
MPLWLRGRPRKRWRWVGVFGDQALAFAAVVELGPAGMTFWGVWDRERRRLYERTCRSAPWRRPEVVMEGPRARIASPQCSAMIELGGGEAIESICPNGEGGYTWTRKLAGVPASGWARVGGRTLSLDGHGVEDVSAGYHPRHTVWQWSAGVGVGAGGESLGWNLVEGINDPLCNSERAIWVDGRPSEPEPVIFEGLEAIRFAEGSLEGIELRSGLGVMESHDVLW